MARRTRLACVVAITATLLGAACSSTGGSSSSGAIRVVAAESFWGSIAAQLGGGRVDVKSVVTDPNADPHDYESTADDARAVGRADVVIINGAGYDPWADKLAKANGRRGQMVIRIADVVGKKDGDNPHLWYSPPFVEKAADVISAAFGHLGRGPESFYAGRRAELRQAMAPYHQLVDQIRATHAGSKVGATETVFSYMADALGLDLASPEPFMRAVAEGNDPPAASVADFQRLLSDHTIKALVFNAQTATAVTTNIRRLAEAAGIPTVPVTETLQPPTATFQAWQEAQLRALQTALAGGP